MIVDRKPHMKADAPTKSDWFATLKTDDGIYIDVQIGYQASEERANEIVNEWAKAR